MTEFETFIEILELSVKKNGKDKVMTIGHLLNIAKMANKWYEGRERDEYETMNDDINNYWNDTIRYGSGD